jgi:hypothetical protein
MTGAMWRYPAEHLEKLTARCAEKLAAQRDAAKQAKSERAAKRAAAGKLVNREAIREERAAAHVSPE